MKRWFRKLWVLGMAFLLCPVWALSQSAFYEDVLTLHNGSKIRGRIVEEVLNQTITIEVLDGSTYVYKLDDIKEKSKEPIKNRPVYLLNKGPKKGFHLLLEQGMDIGETADLFRARFNAIARYQYNPVFSMGTGLGTRYFPVEQAMLIPLFADFRVHFTNSSISPYWGFQLGYSFSTYLDRGYGGFDPIGLLAGSSLGTSFRITPKVVLHLGMGYELQNEGIFDFVTSAISIQSGISF